ncbi:unnamed protein product [Staurois parvus]|uniref:Uncharacterized protein n=1 Tax=Staurois parvus TaxID=386267 RepID=A0ABN9E557_9NEOB|nr:unnamed protein product [Staurois parvus]
MTIAQSCNTVPYEFFCIFFLDRKNFILVVFIHHWGSYFFFFCYINESPKILKKSVFLITFCK